MTDAASAGRPQRRALIIEDEAPVRGLLTALLARAGWQTVAVASGAAACAAFTAGRFQGVICDIELGVGINGLETVRRLRRDEPGLKVVFITGSAAYATKAAAAGEGPVVMKPFNPAVLLARLERGA